jgi:hypothetical protein
MESGYKAAIALRSQVVLPDEIAKLAKIIDQSTISHLFLPDLPGGFDSLEISAACLGVSKGLRVGSGVFRPLEHELQELLRRLVTLQQISENRYLLGVGTGNPTQSPEQKISALLGRLEEIRNGFTQRSIPFPEVYIATLRSGIARQVAGKCDGIILNFCPPNYAKNLVDNVRSSFSGTVEAVCYLKAFFSKSQEVAKRLAIEEFVKYDMIPHYHKMFEKIGIIDEIRESARSLQGNSLYYSKELEATSPVNPDQSGLRDYVSAFRKAGITLPCLYPYFAPNESFEYKREIVQSIISASS